MIENTIPDEQEKTYEEHCKEDAGKTYYYEVDDIPVMVVNDPTGHLEYRFGWKDGKWEPEYPSYDMFYNEGSKMSKERFASWMKNTFKVDIETNKPTLPPQNA